MDGVDLTSPFFWGSLVLGAIVVAAVSFGFHKGQSDDQEVNPKALVRDGLLGAIFTAMAWNLVPDSMKHLTESVTSSVTSAASTATSVASVSLKPTDIDLQIGPARF